jgi:hypothetical protein
MNAQAVFGFGNPYRGNVQQASFFPTTQFYRNFAKVTNSTKESYRFGDVMLAPNNLYTQAPLGYPDMFKSFAPIGWSVPGNLPFDDFEGEASPSKILTLGSAEGNIVTSSSAWGFTPPGPSSTTIGGAAIVISSANSFNVTGGVTLGGAATASVGQYFHTATGGLDLPEIHAPSEGQIGLIASLNPIYEITGGLTLGGTAPASAPTNHTATGGVTIGGTATATGPTNHIATGGVVIGGTALTTLTISSYSYTATGGLNGFRDGFNRANNTDINQDWEEVAGDWQIKDNELLLNDIDPSLLRYTIRAVADGTANTSVQSNFRVTIRGMNGVLARYTDSNNWYGCFLDFNTDEIRIIKNVAGTFTELVASSVGALSLNTNYTIKLQVFDTNLKGYFGLSVANPQDVSFTTQIEATDSSFTGSATTKSGIAFSPENIG